MEPIPKQSDANTDNINVELDETGAYNNDLLTSQAEYVF